MKTHLKYQTGIFAVFLTVLTPVFQGAEIEGADFASAL